MMPSGGSANSRETQDPPSATRWAMHMEAYHPAKVYPPCRLMGVTVVWGAVKAACASTRRPTCPRLRLLLPTDFHVVQGEGLGRRKPDLEPHPGQVRSVGLKEAHVLARGDRVPIDGKARGSPAHVYGQLKEL